MRRDLLVPAAVPLGLHPHPPRADLPEGAVRHGEQVVQLGLGRPPRPPRQVVKCRRRAPPVLSPAGGTAAFRRRTRVAGWGPVAAAVCDVPLAPPRAAGGGAAAPEPGPPDPAPAPDPLPDRG